jgi:hypothetical protein
VIVTFHLEGHGQSFAYVYDPGIFTWSLQDLLSFGGELPQKSPCRFVAAVFGPHYAEDSQFRFVGFSAQLFFDCFIFFFSQAKIFVVHF